MYDRTNLPDGYYMAKPTAWGLIITEKNHVEQFAIECAVMLTADDGTEYTVSFTKFGGLDGEGLQYTMQDAEICGAKVYEEEDIRKWELDKTKTVKVHVVADGQYGPKLKSIFGPDSGGILIGKLKMDEATAAERAPGINERIAALKALRAQNTPSGVQTRPASQQNGAKAAAAPEQQQAPDIKKPSIPF